MQRDFRQIFKRVHARYMVVLLASVYAMATASSLGQLVFPFVEEIPVATTNYDVLALNVEDVDLDGDNDILAHMASGTNEGTVVLLNQSGLQGGVKGDFAPVAQSLNPKGLSSSLRQPVMFDIDRDMDRDLIMVNPDSSDRQLRVFSNNTDGTFSLFYTNGLGASLAFVAVENLDRNSFFDFDHEILVSGISPLLHTVSGGSITSYPSGLPDHSFPVVGDLNDDIHDDLLCRVVSNSANRLFIFDGSTLTPDAPPIFIESTNDFGFSMNGGVIGDADGDFDHDLIIFDVSEVRLYLNLSETVNHQLPQPWPDKFAAPVSINVAGEESDIVSAELFDVDHDLDLDAVFFLDDNTIGSAAVIAYNGGGIQGGVKGDFNTVDPDILQRPTRAHRNGAIGDIRGDGFPEILSGTGNGSIDIFQGLDSAGTNVPPIAVIDIVYVSGAVAEQFGGWTFFPLTNDFDLDGNAISVVTALVVEGTGVISSVDTNSVELEFPGNVGPAKLSYTITDGSATDTGTIALKMDWCTLEGMGGGAGSAGAYSSGGSESEVDIDLLYAVRDGFMYGFPNGERLADHYYESTPEILQVLHEDGALFTQAVDGVILWQPVLRDLVESNGTAVISQGMVDALQGVINTLQTNPLPRLRAAISEQLELIGALSNYVGMSISDAQIQVAGRPTRILDQSLLEDSLTISATGENGRVYYLESSKDMAEWNFERPSPVDLGSSITVGATGAVRSFRIVTDPLPAYLE